MAANNADIVYTRSDETLVAETARLDAYNIRSIEAAHRGAGGDSLIEFCLYFSLSNEVSGRNGRYWVVPRDKSLAITLPDISRNLVRRYSSKDGMKRGTVILTGRVKTRRRRSVSISWSRPRG